MKGILGEPGFEWGEDFGEECGVAAEEMGLGEEDEVLMATEFPDEFVVADGGEAEVVEAAEV